MKPNFWLDWYLGRQLSSAKPPKTQTVTEMCSKTSGRSVGAKINVTCFFFFCDSVFLHCCSFKFVSS